jgi:hypothetical protein
MPQPSMTTSRRPKAPPKWTTRDLNREARVQAVCVEYIELVAPQVLVFFVPNGGYGRSLSRMKWMGAKNGITDLVLVDEHSLAYFVEIKDAEGKLSDDQKAFRDYCFKTKKPWALVRDVNDMAKALDKFGISTREHRP